MPIKCDIPLRNLNQAEFGPLAYSVLGDVYRIHNDLGRYFDEQIYKRALGRCRPDVRLEEPIQISFRTFHTKCKLDVLVADGGVFEFKAVEVFIAATQGTTDPLPAPGWTQSWFAGQRAIRKGRASFRQRPAGSRRAISVRARTTNLGQRDTECDVLSGDIARHADGLGNGPGTSALRGGSDSLSWRTELRRPSGGSSISRAGHLATRLSPRGRACRLQTDGL